MVDTTKTDVIIDNETYKGSIQFKGYPINPYIVPEGERIQVTVRNFAPGIDLIDSLKAVGRDYAIP